MDHTRTAYRCPRCGKLLYPTSGQSEGEYEWATSINQDFISRWIRENSEPLETHVCGICAEILKEERIPPAKRPAPKPEPEPEPELGPEPDMASIMAKNYCKYLAISKQETACVYRTLLPEEGTASFYESAKDVFAKAAKTNVRRLIRLYMQNAAEEILQKAQKDPQSLLADILPYLRANMELKVFLQTDWKKRIKDDFDDIHARWKEETVFPVLFYADGVDENPYYESRPHLHENIYILYEFHVGEERPTLSPRFYPDVFYLLIPTEKACWSTAKNEAIREATEGTDSYLMRRLLHESKRREGEAT